MCARALSEATGRDGPVHVEAAVRRDGARPLITRSAEATAPSGIGRVHAARRPVVSEPVEAVEASDVGREGMEVEALGRTGIAGVASPVVPQVVGAEAAQRARVSGCVSSL